MNIGGVLVGGSGLWLMYCAVKNRQPLTALKDVITTGKIGDSPITTGGAASNDIGAKNGASLVQNPDGTIKPNAPAVLGGLSTGGKVGAAIGGLVGLDDVGRVIGQLDGAAIGAVFGGP